MGNGSAISTHSQMFPYPAIPRFYRQALSTRSLPMTFSQQQTFDITAPRWEKQSFLHLGQGQTLRFGPWFPRTSLKHNQQNRPPCTLEDPSQRYQGALCLEAGGRVTGRGRVRFLSGGKEYSHLHCSYKMLFFVCKGQKTPPCGQ